MDDKIGSLKIMIADLYALYLKTQNFHWNIEGKNFISLHSLFEEQYSELAKSIDTAAEIIRGLGEKIPASFEVFIKQTSIAPGNEMASSEEMLRILAEDHLNIQKNLNKILSSFQKEGDEVVCDFIIQQLVFHRKAHWMLKSSL